VFVVVVVVVFVVVVIYFVIDSVQNLWVHSRMYFSSNISNRGHTCFSIHWHCFS